MNKVRVGGSTLTATLALPPNACSSAACLLVSDGSPLSTWRADFYALTAAGEFYMGSLVLAPPGVTTAARVVGWALCPGASGWKVHIHTLPGTPADASAEFSLAAGVATTAGLIPAPPLTTYTWV